VDSFVIVGGRSLSGEIAVAGNKNAALKLLAATLLTDEPVTLEKTRRAQMPLGREDGGIEALEVTDLQYAAPCRRDVDQLASLRQRLGHRLLDQHVRAGGEESGGDLEVQWRRGDDADGIHLADELSIVGESRHAELGGDRVARVRMGIHHADQLARGQGGIFLRVETA